MRPDAGIWLVQIERWNELTATSNQSPATIRLVGLDVLRGLCALVVVLGHVNLPEGGGGALESLVRFAMRIISNGPAAVIVFFVISGLCIHLPQASGRSLHVPTFYARRGFRIGVPMAAGGLLAWATDCLPGFNGVLWSLICEVIYYALYPLLRSFAGRWGWGAVLAVSSLGALGLLATDPGAASYPHFGNYLTWILGLPIWILGCVLAESLVRKPALEYTTRLWVLRGALFLASAAAIVLQWKLGRHAIGYPWSMSAFGVVAWLWLGEELRHMMASPPARWLDVAGASSYSIYLAHVAVIHTGWVWLGAQAGSTLWFRGLLVAGSLVAGYLFYRIVELPSHRFAAKIDLRRTIRA